jgi:ankyrin repeat protein
VNIANENGETALDWAEKNNNSQIAKLLRDAGGHSGKTVTIEISK